MRLDLLKPYQVEPAKHLAAILARGSAIDCSDTGTGKSFTSSAVASGWPGETVILAPFIGLTTWGRVADTFGLERRRILNYEALRTGNSGLGVWENPPPKGYRSEQYFKCQCCQRIVDIEDTGDKCYTHPLGIHCIETKKKAWDYGRFLWTVPRGTLLLFDEIHRCSGMDSLNADMLVGAHSQGHRVLGMSATAACTPLHMRAIGYMLNLHTLTGDRGFHQWAMRHGCGRRPGIRGLHFLAGKEKQGVIMDALHQQIFPARGVRIRTCDVPGFPERIISTDLIDLSDPEELKKAYDEMAEAIAALDERATHDLAPELAVTRILRARQRIELLKVPAFVEMAQDYVDKGCSVAFFVNFTETILALQGRLGSAGVGILRGVTSEREARERQRSIDDFEEERSRYIICNNEAGGVNVSLQDLTGNHPRVGLVSLPQSARTLIQLFGRLPRMGGRTTSLYRILLVAGSIEEKVKKNLDQKLSNLHNLNDGDLSPFQALG